MSPRERYFGFCSRERLHQRLDWRAPAEMCFAIHEAAPSGFHLKSAQERS